MVVGVVVAAAAAVVAAIVVDEDYDADRDVVSIHDDQNQHILVLNSEIAYVEYIDPYLKWTGYYLSNLLGLNYKYYDVVAEDSHNYSPPAIYYQSIVLGFPKPCNGLRSYENLILCCLLYY